MDNLYIILGINENSSLAEIKRAYAKLIRIHSPEKEPEEFKKIRQAYEVIGNEQSRREYDFNLKYGNELKDLVDDALELMDNESYKEASIKLKKALLIKPDMGYVINLLGVCYIRNKYYAAAVVEFLKAIEIDNSRALYFSNCGYAYYKMKEYNKAIIYYKNAIEIEPTNKDVYIGIADICIALNDYKKAAETLIKGINVDGVVDFNDFGLYLYLVDVYILDESLKYFETLKDEILGIIPEDEEGKKYAISHLINKAWFYRNYKYFDSCCFIVDIAYKISPEDDEVKNIKNIIYEDRKINSELIMLERDSNFMRELYLCLAFKERGNIDIENDDERKEEWNKLYKKLKEKIKLSNSLVNNFDVIKDEYPAIYERYHEFIDLLEKFCMRANKEKTREFGKTTIAEKRIMTTLNMNKSDNTYKAKENPSNNDYGGCLLSLIFLVIGGAIGGPIGAIFGFSIGAYISLKM